MQRKPRQRDEKHLAFLRTLPCICCGNPIETQAAHIRFSDAARGKNNPGVGQKPDDRYALPLCGADHREQHETGDERKFWRQHGIDPLTIADKLYQVSGDYARGCEIVAGARLHVLMAG